jgi:sulfur transfer complex TusBCD TusB component (DsrH family)
MYVLQVLDQAFRTTVEEQDETILWLIQSMLKQAASEAASGMSLLLTNHAVYYAYQSQPQPALKIGDWQQSQPADISRDIRKLQEAGVAIYAVYEDLWERGLELLPRPEGIHFINRSALPRLYMEADQVWHW